MQKSRFLLATALATSSLFLLAQPAWSQDAAPQAAEDGAAGGEIVVTGSRIARPDLTSNSPIAIVSGEAFKEQGAINVESVVNLLPQVTPSLNGTVNNGGDGTVTVDLRGLGARRTLVLANGRRLVPSTNRGVVDLNIIPPLLIERVDVVTGGASATYGSDGLGGVVNFILKKNFEGFQASGQIGTTGRGDSSTYTYGGIVGANISDGRGNVTAAISYTDRKPSFQSQRSFLRIDQNRGSATGIAGRLDNAPLNPFASGVSQAFNANGSVRPFIDQLPETNAGVGDRYNFAPLNYVQTPQKRTTINLLGHYDVTEKIEFFFDAFYVNSRVDLQLAETPATNILVSPNSPLLSASAIALAATRPNPLAPLVFRRRMTEVGPRQQNFKFNDYQATVGLRGDLTDKINYEVYYTYGRVESSQNIRNDVSRQRLTAGLNGCPVGSPTGCVPVNAFGPGNISPAAANFIRITSATDLFTFNRKNLVGSVSGELFDLGAGPIGFAIGGEYRKDSSSFTPSDPSQRGDITGFNASAPISGGFDVSEAFAELRVPLLADKPFVENLTLDLAGRYSDYSTVGSNYTYRIGGEYTPIKGIRFRGLYSRATRAPSVFELFQAGDQNFPTVVDPCARIRANGTMVAAPSAAVSQVCILSGAPDPRTVIVAQTNSQVEARDIGNPNLREEKSDTYTAGVVLTPIRNLSLSLDYFDIKVKGYVARAFGGSQGLVSACFNSGVTTAAQFSANPACRFVARDLGGNLFLQSPQTNASKLITRGFDFGAQYDFGLNFAGLKDSKLSLRTDVTYLMDYKFDGQEFAGFASGDFGTLPHLKANTRVTYSGGPISTTLNWRFVGRSRDTMGDITDPTGFTRIKAQSYFDLSATFRANKNFEFSLGVLNLLDNDPPSVNAGFTNTNTDETLYDVLGRRFFAGATIKF